MDDADTGGNDLKSVECLLAPFEKLVAFAVTLELNEEVEVKGFLGAGVIDLDGVIHNEIDRDQWFDELGVLAEFTDGIAHGGEVDKEGDAGEILEDDACDGEGDFLGCGSFCVPGGQGANVVLSDGEVVAFAQNGFENDADGDGEAGKVLAESVGEFGQGGEGVGLASGTESGAGASDEIRLKTWHPVSIQKPRGFSIGKLELVPMRADVLLPCMMKRSLALLFVAIAVNLPSGWAILYHNDFTYSSQSGQAGSAALAVDYTNFAPFEAVGLMEYSDGSGSYTATGTLISDQWVLTAAHNWGPGVTSMTFTLGSSSYTADLTTLTQHPFWNTPPTGITAAEVGPNQGWDIAVFRLQTAVTGITPAQMYAGSLELGQTVYTVGFGSVGTGTVDNAPVDPPVKLAIANVIDRVTSQSATVGPDTFTGGAIIYDFDGPAGSGGGPHPNANTLDVAGNIWDTDATQMSSVLYGSILGTGSASERLEIGANILEGGTAPGDSGGPTFILDGGVWKIAGVTSWGTNPRLPGGGSNNGLYGDLTYATRVSAHQDWIAAAIPEPSTYALMALALVMCAVQVGRVRVRRR